MVSDRGLQDWAQAWHAHDRLLHSWFMLKPFILDTSSAAYEKQFECCKLDQVLLGSHPSPHGYVHPQLHPSDSSKSSAALQHHESGSQDTSPHYNPYPKTGSPSFLESASMYTLCIRCSFKGHRATSCASKQSSRPECPIIVSWKDNRLESSDGTHICFHYNVRNSCAMQPLGHHSMHSFSLCSDLHHGANICTRN